MAYLIADFVIEYAMFNLNENNVIVISRHPADMLKVIHCLCGKVRHVVLAFRKTLCSELVLLKAAIVLRG